jgi:hypothetical protein
MLSKDTEFRLDHAVTDDKIGDEIAARVEVSSTPADASAAQAILDLLDSSKNSDVSERLFTALAGDDNGAAGKELSKKINGMMAVLEAKANGDEIAATTATFTGQVAGMTTDVTIDADVAGLAGNVSIVGDGSTNLSQLIILFNLLNAGNTVTLTSGSGTQVQDNGASIDLAGGADSSDTDIAGAKTAMGAEAMSESTRYSLEHALTDKTAANEFKTAYDAMVAAIQAIS